MNLNYDASKEALRELAAQADSRFFVHNIAVDYDGEVIIDPELHFPDTDVRRYKFCTQVKKTSLQQVAKLKALHAVLLCTFKEQMISICPSDRLDMAA